MPKSPRNQFRQIKSQHKKTERRQNKFLSQSEHKLRMQELEDIRKEQGIQRFLRSQIRTKMPKPNSRVARKANG